MIDEIKYLTEVLNRQEERAVVGGTWNPAITAATTPAGDNYGRE